MRQGNMIIMNSVTVGKAVVIDAAVESAVAAPLRESNTTTICRSKMRRRLPKPRRRARRRKRKNESDDDGDDGDEADTMDVDDESDDESDESDWEPFTNISKTNEALLAFLAMAPAAAPPAPKSAPKKAPKKAKK